MPILRRTLPAFLLAAVACTSALAQQVGFTIWKGGKVVGGITALRQHAGANATYAVSSYSEIDVVMKQTVRSVLAMEYRAGLPYGCYTSMHINGSLRDSSLMRPNGTRPDCYVHPDERFTAGAIDPWCTARLYFEEPVGRERIFVESVLRNCPLEKVGEGEYRLEMPGRKVNTYRYRNGKLQEVLVDRPLIKLVFKRVEPH